MEETFTEYIVSLADNMPNELDMFERQYGTNGTIVRCRDCKYAVLTTKGSVKYCKWWQGDEDGSFGGDPLYLEGDFFCAAGEKKDVRAGL